jgi:hypothetical protein
MVLKVKLLLLSSLKRSVAVGPQLLMMRDLTFSLGMDHEIVPVCPDVDISMIRVEFSTRATEGAVLDGKVPSGKTQKR